MRWTVRRLVAHLHALSGIVCFLSVRFNLFDGECWWWFASFSKNKSVALCDSTLEKRVCLHRVWHPIVFCDWQRPLQIEMQTYHSIAGKSRRILPQILFLSISSFQVTSSLPYWSSSIGPSNNNNNSNSCHPWCCWFAFSYHCLSVSHLLDSHFYWTEIRNYNNGTPGDKRKQKCNIHFVLTINSICGKADCANRWPYSSYGHTDLSTSK